MKQLEIKVARDQMRLPGFRLSSTGLEANTRIKKEDWIRCGQFLKRCEGAVCWWVGDWVNLGEKKYGDVKKVAEDIGFSYPTVRQYASLAANVKVFNRLNTLTINHHQAVAKLSDKEQRRWLSAAVKKGLSPAELRRDITRWQRSLDAANDESVGAIKDLASVAGRYRCIYLDPPWDYDDSDAPQGGVAAQYETQDIEWIKDVAVPALLHPEGGHVWMWITWPMLRDGLGHELLKHWDLEWKGEIVWDKDKLLLGRWIRVQTEVLILGVTGKCDRQCEDLRGFYQEKSSRHSEKPAAFYSMLERFSLGPRIELFARTAQDGWDRWGKEAP